MLLLVLKLLLFLNLPLELFFVLVFVERHARRKVLSALRVFHAFHFLRLSLHFLYQVWVQRLMFLKGEVAFDWAEIHFFIGLVFV